MWDFIAPDECDERALFANRICKLLYDKHDGDLNKAIKEGESLFDGLEQFVKNIYELVEDEIPLYAYYELLKDYVEEYSEEEYSEAVEATIKACHYYYG